MRIAIDCDGVLAQFTPAFIKVAETVLPGRIPIGFVPRTWYFEDHEELGLTSKQISKVWDKIRYREYNFWETLSPFHEELADTLEFIWQQASGIDVYYVTSRVPSQGDTVLRQTQRWLAGHGLMTPGCSVIVKPEGIAKEEVYRAVGIEFSVDDYWENVPSDEFLGHQGYLLARPWNVDHRTEVKVVPDLKTYFAIIKKEKEKDDN